jgi:hypothetical protein
MAESTTTVPPGLERALRAALKPVGEQDAALPEALADYVLTGLPESALGDLGGYGAAVNLAVNSCGWRP